MKLAFNKDVHVSENAEGVTSFDPGEEVDAHKSGLTREGIDRIWQGVVELYMSGIHPAISFCLRRRGHIVLKRAIGHSHGNGPGDPTGTQKIQATPETPMCLFSTSKAVTAMIVHKVIEEGAFGLDDPVCRFLPEFAVHGKEKITIQQILSHRAGIPTIPYHIDEEIIFRFEDAVQMICNRKPQNVNGNRQAYHAVTGAHILGEVVRRTTGNDLRHHIRRLFKHPLGFRYFDYGAEEKDIPQVAINYFTGLPITFPISQFARHALGTKWEKVVKVSNKRRFMEVIVPAANIICTADEICSFFQLLLDGGARNGIRILKKQTVDGAIKSTNKMVIDGTIKIPVRFSSGMVLGGKRFSLYGPDTDQAFGHLGFTNVICWADPERDISVAILNTGKPLFGPHLVPLGRLIGRISKICPKN